MPGSRVRPAAVGSGVVSLLNYVIVTLVAVVAVTPIIYSALSGFRTTGAIADEPFALPDPWVATNYVDVLTSGEFWGALWNSVLIASIATTTTLVFSSLAAYVLARYAFRGRDFFFNIFALGLLFPLTVAMVPLYMIVRQTGFTDNPLGVALPEAAFLLPISVLILRPFFRTIPAELEDAATIDGCSKLGFLRHVILPLSRPALTTVLVICVVNCWNDFLLPLLVLSEPSSWTLPLGVMNYSTRYSSDTAGVLAYTTLSMLPALAVFVVAERQLVQGLVA